MMRFNRGLWLSAAASVVFAMGCGGGDTPDGGTGACSSDATCGSGKACHPILKTCVATCSGSSDCPSSEKTCAKIANSAASFCTCSTNELCAAAVGGNICNSATRQCSAKCTASSCPSGFTCNTTSGDCTSSGTDGGTDAGVTDAGVACNSNNQPDVCGYGNYCGGDNFCGVIENGTCSNVAGRPAWNSSSTGPVIYLIQDEAVDDQSKCANLPDGGIPTPFTTTVFAYAAPGQTFPTMKSALNGFNYYTTSGTPNDIPLNYLQQANYSLYQSNQVMGAKFTLCSPLPNQTSIQVGFGFTNGNSACATLTH